MEKKLKKQKINLQEFQNKTRNKKIKKRKNYVFRDFFKEMKRIKWPKSKEYFRLFVYVIIFVIIAALFFYGIVSGFTELFNILGVGI